MQPTSTTPASYLQASTAGTSTKTKAGHYLTASDSRDVPLRIRGDVDEAIPSATSQIIEAFARTATATGDSICSIAPGQSPGRPPAASATRPRPGGYRQRLHYS